MKDLDEAGGEKESCVLCNAVLCEICGEAMSLAPKGMTYEDERDAFVAAMKAGNAAAIAMGWHWHNLTHHHLFLEHYGSPREFLEGELGKQGLGVPEMGTLAQMAKVAVAFHENPPAIGWKILYLAILYWHHTGHLFSTSHPGLEIIEIPQPGGAPAIKKPLQNCTERDLEEALKPFRKQAEPEQLSPKDIALEKLVQAGLDKLMGSGGHDSFHLHRKQGQLRFDLRLEGDVEKIKGLMALLNRLL